MQLVDCGGLSREHGDGFLGVVRELDDGAKDVVRELRREAQVVEIERIGCVVKQRALRGSLTRAVRGCGAGRRGRTRRWLGTVAMDLDEEVGKELLRGVGAAELPGPDP